MERFDSCFHPHHACDPHPNEYHENIHYTPDQINALLGLIPYKADRAEVPKMETLNDVNYIGHVATSEALPDKMEQPSWALVGSVKETKPYFYYVEGFVPKGYRAGWNDLSGVLGTYDLTVDKVSIFDYNLLTEYNVSRNHTQDTRIFSHDWKEQRYFSAFPDYVEGKKYRPCDRVNMPGYTKTSFVAQRSTSEAPFVVKKSNVFTFEDAIALVPEEYRIPGMKVTFVSAYTNQAETWYFKGNSVSLWKDKKSWWKIDLEAERNEIHAEEVFIEKMEAPEMVADRAIADENGNRIPDTYLTRKAVRRHIEDTFNDMFIDNPPTVMDGMITPEMLSESTKQLIGNKNITNFADDEDITSVHGQLKLANKRYDPNNYSGKGRCYLRKNLVAGRNVLTQSMVCWPNTIYIIQYDYDLRGETITIPEGCTLQFEGGSLVNGHVLGNGTIVNSIPAYIFKDITFEGTFEGEFYIEYIGASMMNEDNSLYFNKAFSSIIKHWVAKSSFYKISNTIIINNNSFLTFKCIGEIIAIKGVDVFKFIGNYNNNVIFDIYGIRTENPPVTSNHNHTLYDYDDLAGSAITIASNFYNSTIKIGHILYFKYGLHMSIDNVENFHIGIQYMKFYFQNIECTTCIFFDYKDNSRKGWINENQFFGGRLTGNYGILTTDIDFFDVINSNNFYKIGFEGINTCAIKLSGVNKWKLNDLRMHESIYNKPYIILNDCKDIELSSTVYMDETYVKATKTIRSVLHTELNDIHLECKNEKQEVYNSSIYKSYLYRYYDEKSDIVENGFINTQLINFFKENSLFSPNVFTYETYNVTTIIDATTFPVTYSSREIYNLNTHIKFKLRGNGKVIFRYKNDIDNIVETPPYSSQDIDLCYNYNYTLKILPSSYYVNRIVIKDINPITLSGNSFIIAQSEDVYIKNTRDYLVFIQNNSICKVHYSIGNNNNYRTYTINPGTSIIMETEIENITMFPAGNNRPNMPVVGYQFFDTTLNKPIWWTGTIWIDSTGATV